MNPVIAIPTHKPVLTSAESASLQQLTAMLSPFRIVLACPQTLDVSAYRSVCGDLVLERFDDRCFANFRSHQKLMISEDFYRRFAAFSHILVYHLDSWVFRDELLKWCQMPFDYIGAPWRSGFNSHGQPLFGSAGNGGFSLRRVDAFLQTLTMFDGRRLRTFGELIQEVRTRSGVSRLKHVVSLPLKLLGIGNSLSRFHQFFPYTEDKFWAHSAKLANPVFRVAPVDVAAQFSIEASPEFLWNFLGRSLPFGCHAWRYEQSFWCDTIGLPRDEDFRPHDENGIALSET